MESVLSFRFLYWLHYERFLRIGKNLEAFYFEGKIKDIVPKKEPRTVENGRFQHATFAEAPTAILVVYALGKGK
jgi:hypothetical protein